MAEIGDTIIYNSDEDEEEQQNSQGIKTKLGERTTIVTPDFIEQQLKRRRFNGQSQASQGTQNSNVYMPKVNYGSQSQEYTFNPGSNTQNSQRSSNSRYNNNNRYNNNRQRYNNNSQSIPRNVSQYNNNAIKLPESKKPTFYMTIIDNTGDANADGFSYNSGVLNFVPSEWKEWDVARQGFSEFKLNYIVVTFLQAGQGIPGRDTGTFMTMTDHFALVNRREEKSLAYIDFQNVMSGNRARQHKFDTNYRIKHKLYPSTLTQATIDGGYHVNYKDWLSCKPGAGDCSSVRYTGMRWAWQTLKRYGGQQESQELFGKESEATMALKVYAKMYFSFK